MGSSKQIDIKLAGFIIISVTLVTVGLSLFVGYTFVWNKYDTSSQIEKDNNKFKDIVRKNQKSPNAHVDLGWTYYQEGKWGKALSEYETAVNLDPTNVGAHYNLGLVYSELSRYEDAEKAFQKTIQLNNKHELAYFNLGHLYFLQQKYDQAIPNLKTALELSPGAANFHYELGLSYEKKELSALAKDEYMKALRYIPDYIEAQEGIARIDILGKGGN